MNITEEFGKNAGEIWRTLQTFGPLTETKLKETTRMQDDAFYVAIGWLARENKIYKEGSLYRLGDTNLAGKIGTDAGKLWKELETRGTIEVSDVSMLQQMEERDVYAALGWLARENKVAAKPVTIPREYQTKK